MGFVDKNWFTYIYSDETGLSTVKSMSYVTLLGAEIWGGLYTFIEFQTAGSPINTEFSRFETANGVEKQGLLSQAINVLIWVFLEKPNTQKI